MFLGFPIFFVKSPSFLGEITIFPWFSHGFPMGLAFLVLFLGLYLVISRLEAFQGHQLGEIHLG